MKCKHCGEKLTEHEGGWKDGYRHCNGCGCCFDGDEVRQGHPGCAASVATEAEDDKPRRTRKS